MWLCRCECGGEKWVVVDALIGGGSQSCGCIKRERGRAFWMTHGMRRTKEYSIWTNMKTRCFNVSNAAYRHYGARGITVCDRWKDSFENFLSDMGPCPKGMTLDRRDNNGSYTPENCRWATLETQGGNRRNNRMVEWRGERMCLRAWERRLGVPYGRVQSRLNTGWDVERAMTAESQNARS